MRPVETIQRDEFKFLQPKIFKREINDKSMAKCLWILMLDAELMRAHCNLNFCACLEIFLIKSKKQIIPLKQNSQPLKS
jgi:tRNA threonylcarbamoyladenosine modification (KEOPS) complex Cgi121 subunit